MFEFNNKSDLSHHSKRGSAMLVVLLLASVITIAGVYALRSVLFQARMVDHSYNNQQALAVAEAGLEKALFEFNHVGDDTRWAGWSEGEASYVMTEVLTTPGGETIGTYEVMVFDPGTSTPIIESTGFIPDMNDPTAKRRLRIVTFRDLEPSFFDWGIFAYGDLYFSGGFDICSWDSLDGNYSSSPNQNNDFGNVGGLGSAYFDNGSDVYGSVEVAGEIVGPNKLTNGANVDGQPNTTLPWSNPTEPPPFPEDDFQAGKATNDNLTGLIAPAGRDISEFYDPVTQSLVVNENNVTIKMQPGTYYFTDLHLNGNSSEIIIEPEGEVTVYLESANPADNVFYVNNTADINANGPARNFQTYVKSGQVYWENAGIIHAAVFAPDSDITVDNAFELNGSMTGHDVSVAGGGYVVYDEDLGRPHTSDDGAVVAAWNEIRAD